MNNASRYETGGQTSQQLMDRIGKKKEQMDLPLEAWAREVSHERSRSKEKQQEMTFNKELNVLASKQVSSPAFVESPKDLNEIRRLANRTAGASRHSKLILKKELKDSKPNSDLSDI